MKRELFECLDPRGRRPGDRTIPLKTPRLPTLKNKKILVAMKESFGNVMPALYDELLTQVPDTHFIPWNLDLQGRLTLEWVLEQRVDGVIAGVGY